VHLASALSVCIFFPVIHHGIDIIIVHHYPSSIVHRHAGLHDGCETREVLLLERVVVVV
jgi:hypothetical protein